MARFTDADAEKHEILALGTLLKSALQTLRHDDTDERESMLVQLVTALRSRDIDCAEWSCNGATEAIEVAVLSGHQMMALRAAGHGIKDSPVERLIEVAIHATTALRDLLMGWPDKEIAAPSGALGRSILIAEIETLFNEPFMAGIR